MIQVMMSRTVEKGVRSFLSTIQRVAERCPKMGGLARMSGALLDAVRRGKTIVRRRGKDAPIPQEIGAASFSQTADAREVLMTGGLHMHARRILDTAKHLVHRGRGRRGRLKTAGRHCPMVPEGLSRSEFDQLMHPKTIGDRRASTYKRDRMLLELLAGTGLRVNEALSLDRDGIDLERRLLWVPAQPSKTGRPRGVSFGMALVETLATYVEGLPAGQQPLFVTRAGMRLQSSHVRRLFKKAATRAGLDPLRISPSMLRDTYAIRYLEGGGTLETLQNQLGHASIATTARYRGSAPQAQRQDTSLDL